jgi:hypothetical protein
MIHTACDNVMSQQQLAYFTFNVYQGVVLLVLYTTSVPTDQDVTGSIANSALGSSSSEEFSSIIFAD